MGADEGSPLASPERLEEEWGNERAEHVVDPDEPDEEEYHGGREKEGRGNGREGDLPEDLEDYGVQAREEGEDGEDNMDHSRKKNERLQKKNGSLENDTPKQRERLEGDGSLDKKQQKKKRESMDNRRVKGRGRGDKVEERAVKRGEKEMWDHVAGGDDSEDDREGLRTKEDEHFIDDAGVDPDQRLASDDERGSVGDAPQAEEDDMEMDKLFRKGKRRKRGESNAAANALLVEETVVRMLKVAEEDAEANRRGEPAIQKLRMLPCLKELLQKKPLQREFLDRGLLSMLKSWLEPLPDGSLPNINIRSAVLQSLTELPIEVDQYDRREQLKRSGLGKVIMFLSKYPDETVANKKLARDIVDMWSRPIFQKSTRYEDLRHYDDERPTPRKSTPRKEGQEERSKTSRRADDFDLEGPSNEPRPGDKGYRTHASVPKPMALDFVVRPESRVSEEDMAKRRPSKDDRHSKVTRKLQKMAGPKRKNLRAEKVSVEGRGLVRYI